MKLSVGLAVLISISAFSVVSVAGLNCAVPLKTEKLPSLWANMTDVCIRATRAQIQAEIGASYTYLQMGAHFSRDTINRPGFAEFFFKAAGEEREHAIQLIHYLSMRGELISDFADLTTPNYLGQTYKKQWTNGIEALTDALNLETIVTKNIRNLIVVCETPVKGIDANDYHFVDYLTGVYLEEQYKGQREIAGKLATLLKMEENHGHLSEFLFDKQL